MSPLAPTLQKFFTDRLLTQRQVSPATVAAYRDTFRLLLGFIADTKKLAPASLDFTDLDAPTMGAFLTYLENERQQHTNPQRPPGRGPFAVPLRGARAPRTRRSDLAGPGNPTETVRSQHRCVPHQRGGRGDPRRSRPRHLDRSSRPRAAHRRSPNRFACRRTHRSAPRRRGPHNGASRSLPWQGPQTTIHALDRKHRHNAAGVAESP